MNNIDIKIGQNVRAARKKRNLTLGQLGAALADPISQQQVSKFEHGINRMAASTLVDVAKVLECPLTDLFAGVVANDVVERITGHDAQHFIDEAFASLDTFKTSLMNFAKDQSRR